MDSPPRSQHRFRWLLPITLGLALAAGVAILLRGETGVSLWRLTSSRLTGSTPLSATSSSAQPKITWSQPSLELTLSPGETASRDLTFSSSLDLSNAVLEAVPEIAGFVTVQPNSFVAVPTGQAQLVSLSFAAPAGATLGTYDGTIHVRVGKLTLPQPLKVSLNAWRAIAAGGVRLNYPPAWQVNSNLIQLGGPIAITNFPTSFNQGGIVPSGGAEIDIARVPLSVASLDDAIQADLKGTVIETSEAIVVGGAPGRKVTYLAIFTPVFSYMNAAAYVPHNQFLYKFFLEYRAGDPGEASFRTAFQQVLDTVGFTE